MEKVNQDDQKLEQVSEELQSSLGSYVVRASLTAECQKIRDEIDDKLASVKQDMRAVSPKVSWTSPVRCIMALPRERSSFS